MVLGYQLSGYECLGTHNTKPDNPSPRTINRKLYGFQKDGRICTPLALDGSELPIEE